MISIVQTIIENWQLFTAIGVLLVILAMTGTITRTARLAKEGLKEMFTPLGFVVFLIILYIVYRIYLLVAETL